MTKAILGVGALLAVALAGCGGSGGASGTTGAHHAKGAGNFRARVHGFEAQLQTSVHAFQSGNLTKAIGSGGPVLNDCVSVVDTRFAEHASTPAQKQAVTHLRAACAAVTQATKAGSSGDMTEAKQFARKAEREAKIAARLAG